MKFYTYLLKIRLSKKNALFYERFRYSYVFFWLTLYLYFILCKIVALQAAIFFVKLISQIFLINIIRVRAPGSLQNWMVDNWPLSLKQKSIFSLIVCIPYFLIENGNRATEREREREREYWERKIIFPDLVSQNPLSNTGGNWGLIKKRSALQELKLALFMLEKGRSSR